MERINGVPRLRGFSVCYFSTDFVRALKVGKNRNRSFHFENLYKLNGDKPRISTLRNNEITGIMPQNLSVFLDDILECFGLREYLKGGEKEKLSP